MNCNWLKHSMFNLIFIKMIWFYMIISLLSSVDILDIIHDILTAIVDYQLYKLYLYSLTVSLKPKEVICSIIEHVLIDSYSRKHLF